MNGFGTGLALTVSVRVKNVKGSPGGASVPVVWREMAGAGDAG